MLLAVAVQGGVGSFFQQFVRLAVEHAVALLDDRVAGAYAGEELVFLVRG